MATVSARASNKKRRPGSVPFSLSPPRTTSLAQERTSTHKLDFRFLSAWFALDGVEGAVWAGESVKGHQTIGHQPNQLPEYGSPLQMRTW